MPSGDCPFVVGPEDGDQTCLKSRYSDVRIVAPYKKDAVSVDWRDHNVVNTVKHQEGCGSCWAFCTISALESAYAIKYGTLNKFSE